MSKKNRLSVGVWPDAPGLSGGDSRWVAPLGQKVDILLRHQVLSEVKKASANASSVIEITGLRGTPQGLYRMDIDPPSYQYVTSLLT